MWCPTVKSRANNNKLRQLSLNFVFQYQALVFKSRLKTPPILSDLDYRNWGDCVLKVKHIVFRLEFLNCFWLFDLNNADKYEVTNTK